jgi:hypothetical protein
MFGFLSGLFSQSDVCGMDGEQFTFAVTPPVQMALNGPNSVIDIPLHIYVINSDEGEAPHPFALEHLVMGINFSNEVFPDEFNFFICKIDHINSTVLQTNNGIDMSLYTSLARDPNALNVYIRKSAPSLGHYLHGVVIAAGTQPSIFAHELGHYFRLCHTFERTSCGLNGITTSAYYPDNECVNGCIGCSQLCPPGTLPCNCRGDNICDTPVDPGPSLCSDYWPSQSPCIVNIQGTDHTFYPKYENIMSYYFSLHQTFTDEQSLVMLNSLLLNSENAFLRDDDYPECQTYEIDPNVIVSRGGQLEKVTDNALPLETGDHFWLQDATVRVANLTRISARNKVTDENGKYHVSALTETFVIPTYISDEHVTTGQCQNCPELVDPLEGVSILDVIRIQRHILSIEALRKPFEWIAADVNNNGIISTSDNVNIRRLILGIDPRFTEVPSWRLLPKYALEDQWDFSDDFFDNPFTAAWDYQGQERGYLPSGANSSYLGALPLHLLNRDVTKEKTWSFWSVKSGDVNFSHADPDGIGGENTEHKLATAAHTCLQQSERFTVLVKADGIGINNFPLSGYQWGMLFDLDAVEITGVSQGALPYFSLDNFNQTALDTGELRTLWYSLSGNHISIQNGELLFKVHLKAKKEICNIADAVYLEDKLVKNAAFGENAKPVSMDVKLEVVSEERKHRLEAVFPNPGANEVNLSFQLDEAANVSIIVSDQYNHQINHSGYYTAGTHTVTFANTATLLPGVLTYQAMLGQEMNTGIIIKQ